MENIHENNSERTPNESAPPLKPGRLEYNFPPPGMSFQRGPGFSWGRASALPDFGTADTSTDPSQSEKSRRQRLTDRAKKLRAAHRDAEALTRRGVKLGHQRQRQELKERLDRKFGPKQEAIAWEETGIKWRMMGRGALTRVFDLLTGREIKLQNKLAAQQEEMRNLNRERHAEEQQLTDNQAREMQELDDYYQVQHVNLEDEIQQAFDRGYFLDEAANESARGQDQDHGRSEADGGGREREQ